MERQAVQKTKHASHSRTLDMRSDERRYKTDEIVKACQQTVRTSRELIQDSKNAIEHAHHLQKHSPSH